MDDIIRFKLTAARVAGKSVREVEGRIGLWPLSSTLRYCVGINCDAIESGSAGIVVYRRGEVIARSNIAVTSQTPRIRALDANTWLRTMVLLS